MTRVPLVLLAFACTLAAAHGAAAQAHSPVSVQVSAGVVHGSGGFYVDRGGAALEAVGAVRLRQTPAGMLVAGVTLGAQSPMIVEDVCLLDPAGSCAPSFPAFLSGGALVGLQGGGARTPSVRAMAGPVYFHAPDDGGALGLQGMVDVATPRLGRTALVLSLRHSVLPSFHDDRVGITSVGFGLRIQ